MFEWQPFPSAIKKHQVAIFCHKNVTPDFNLSKDLRVDQISTVNNNVSVKKTHKTVRVFILLLCIVCNC